MFVNIYVNRNFSIHILLTMCTSVLYLKLQLILCNRAEVIWISLAYLCVPTDDFIPFEISDSRCVGKSYKTKVYPLGTI